jgi:hypothetical protein
VSRRYAEVALAKRPFTKEEGVLDILGRKAGLVYAFIQLTIQ